MELRNFVGVKSKLIEGLEISYLAHCSILVGINEIGWLISQMCSQLNCCM